MKDKAILLLALALLSVSCKTSKVCTSDSRTESTHTEVHKSDSVDGKEIYRETNCNTTTNRDHFRDTKKKVEDKEEVKHEENQKNDSTLIQNHSEEKVIIEEPSLRDRIRQSLADCIMWGFGLFVLILISYHYYKKWQEKKEQ